MENISCECLIYDKAFLWVYLRKHASKDDKK